jgi:ribosomal protein S18 acetylase RimI-like enzyme
MTAPAAARAGAAPVRIARCAPALARLQAAWIVAIEPWLGLGYGAGPLGRWLARAAPGRSVWIARAPGSRVVDGILVVETPFLLGGFIALLAVRPAAAGRGVGRALVDRARREIFTGGARRPGKRWLYVSADSGNQAALRFYRKLGFARVGRLPDLIRAGRTELLLRLGRGDGAGA